MIPPPVAIHYRKTSSLTWSHGSFVPDSVVTDTYGVAMHKGSVDHNADVRRPNVETAKPNGVDPQVWLTNVLSRIADHKITKLDELLPWSYAANAA